MWFMHILHSNPLLPQGTGEVREIEREAGEREGDEQGDTCTRKEETNGWRGC